MRVRLIIWLLVGLVVVISISLAHAQVPPAAATYRIAIKSAAQPVWGPVPPIAFLAAQVHQESAWRPQAHSPYARGLTQFTPETEAWIQQKYGVELGGGGALDPQWALRAQARYMKDLHDQLGGRNDCHAMLFALAAYNGGAGWINRDRALAAKWGDDPLDYPMVRTHNSGRGESFWRENREYPFRIAFRHQPLYRAWGGTRCL